MTTDKVDVEVPSPAAGRVERIVAAAGDTVEVGALLAELVPGGAAQPTGNGPADDGASAPAAPAGTAAAPAPPAAAEAPEPGPPVPPPAPAEAGDGALVPIVLPDMESVTEGVVVEWRVAVGDAVAADQIVVEVSTDKVDLEVPAPAAGRLVSIAVEAGGTFTVGQPLGEIAAGAGAPPRPPRRPRRNGAAAPAAAEAPAPAAPAGPERAGGRRRVAGDHAGRAAPGPGEGHRPRRPSPAPGPAGIIRKPDVLAAASAPAPAAAPRAAASVPLGAGEEATPLRGPAAALAGYMDESLSIPTATSFRTSQRGRPRRAAPRDQRPT